MHDQSTTRHERAILYDRVSTVMQSKVGYSGGSDGFQLDACRLRADARRYEVVGEITDVDSGAAWEIDGIMDALDRAQRREYEVLVVSDTSRFARSLAKKTVYEADLRRHGVRVEYLNLPETDGPEGRFMSNVFGALDELERERIAHRTKNGRRQKAAGGEVVGAGPPPYGCRYRQAWVEARKRDVTYGLEPDPETAAIVARIFRELDRYSMVDVADHLTDDGIPPPMAGAAPGRRRLSGRWSKSTIHGIATNPVYRGEWHYGDQVVAVPPLLDPADWHRIQRRLADRKNARRARDRERPDRWLLRGRLICGGCGGAIAAASVAMTGPRGAMWPDGRQRRYLCLRSMPSVARRVGRERCGLPGLLAANERAERGRQDLVGVEDLAWAFVVGLYTVPGRFEEVVAALDARTDDARRAWEARLEVLDREIAEHERTMAAAEREKLKLAEADPRYRIHDEAGLRESRVVSRLRGERERYAAAGGPGLGREQRAQLQAHVGAARALLAPLLARATKAPPELRAEAYRLLRLRGTVTPDPAGETRVGRDARVRVEWEIFPDNVRGLSKLRFLHTASGPLLLGLDAA